MPNLKVAGGNNRMKAFALVCLVSVAICTAALLACTHADPDAPPVVSFSSGRVRGRAAMSRGGRTLDAFEGVPYAAPPVGELRLEAPRPPSPWEGELEAVAPGPLCTQKNPRQPPFIHGEEDCLYLNIYRPEKKEYQSLLDVLVFIHGGAWETGHGDLFEPDYLLDHDVLLVTFNYRLGPLGFLSTQDDVIPGNFGLKDMVQALKWVQDNIAAFAGNPDSVTIFGESAGAASVHLLTLSPLARGLFHKAIAQSGNAVAPWAMGSPQDTRRYAARLSEFLRCPLTPSEHFLKCLRNRTNADLLKMDTREWGIFPIMPFRAVVEHGEGAFLDRHPEDIISDGSVCSDVPFMVGTTSQDGSLFAVGLHSNKTALKEFDDRFESIVPLFMHIRQLPRKAIHQITEEVRKFYYGEGKITDTSKTDTIQFFTDFMFLWPSVHIVELQSKKIKSPVYFYEFAHLSQKTYCSFLGAKKGEDYGVCHGDDLIHLFPLKKLFGYDEPSEEDKEVSKSLVNLFVTFAKFGKPTQDDSWLRVSHANEPEYLQIGQAGKMKMLANPVPESMKFWKELYYRIHQAHDEL